MRLQGGELLCVFARQMACHLPLALCRMEKHSPDSPTMRKVAAWLPNVSPEAFLDRNRDTDETAHYTARVLSFFYRSLNKYDVCSGGPVTSPKLDRSGDGFKHSVRLEESGGVCAAEEDGEVPSAMAGTHILSGRVSDQKASEYLHLPNTIKGSKRPLLSVTFLYGRELQKNLLET